MIVPLVTLAVALLAEQTSSTLSPAARAAISAAGFPDVEHALAALQAATTPLLTWLADRAARRSSVSIVSVPRMDSHLAALEGGEQWMAVPPRMRVRLIEHLDTMQRIEADLEAAYQQGRLEDAEDLEEALAVEQDWMLGGDFEALGEGVEEERERGGQCEQLAVYYAEGPFMWGDDKRAWTGQHRDASGKWVTGPGNRDRFAAAWVLASPPGGLPDREAVEQLASRFHIPVENIYGDWDAPVSWVLRLRGVLQGHSRPGYSQEPLVDFESLSPEQVLDIAIECYHLNAKRRSKLSRAPAAPGLEADLQLRWALLTRASKLPEDVREELGFHVDPAAVRAREQRKWRGRTYRQMLELGVGSRLQRDS